MSPKSLPIRTAIKAEGKAPQPALTLLWQPSK